MVLNLVVLLFISNYSVTAVQCLWKLCLTYFLPPFSDTSIRKHLHVLCLHIVPHEPSQCPHPTLAAACGLL